ncbi:MAG: hypothetical protein QM817_28060 [Archangium sp.]
MTSMLVLMLLQQGTWGEPAREAFLDPSARSILAGINAVSFDGLQPAATVYDFDGVRVLAPAHALFGPTAFHPAWTESVTISPTAARALGRTISLFSPKNGTRAWIRVDLLHTGVFVQHTTNEGTQLQAAARFFTTAALAGAFIKGSLLLGDYQVRYAQKLGDGELRALAFGALDSIALTVSGIPLAARLQNHQLDLRWKNDSLELGLGAHRSTIGLTLNGATVGNAIDGAEDAINARVIARGKLGTAGIDFELRRLSLLRATSFTADPTANTTTLRELGLAMVGGAFGELILSEGDWRTTFGVRVDLWVPQQGTAIPTADPRITTRRDWGLVALELSAGITHQAPTWLVTIPVLESIALRNGVQELARGDATLKLALSTQDSLSLHVFGAGITRSIEFSPFDDDFLQLINQVDEHVAPKRTSGWLAGGEVRLRIASAPHEAIRVTTDVSYSFQQSWRLATFTRFDSTATPTGNATEWVPWQHRQTHQVRAVVGLSLPLDWKLKLAGTLSSGPPMVGGLFSQQQREGTDALTGAPRWVPVDRDQSADAQLYLRADLRVSKTWHPTSTAELELFLDVANLSAPQPTGTRYVTSGATLKTEVASSPLPPIPVLGVDVRL